MPIPKPRKDEQHDKYVARCMHKLSKDDKLSNEQKLAVCYTTWQKAKASELLTGRCTDCGMKIADCECDSMDGEDEPSLEELKQILDDIENIIDSVE